MTWAVEVYATYKKVRIIRQLLSRDKEEVMAENNVRKKKKRKNTTTGLVLLVLVLTVIILGIILIIVNKLDKNNKLSPMNPLSHFISGINLFSNKNAKTKS